MTNSSEDKSAAEYETDADKNQQLMAAVNKVVDDDPTRFATRSFAVIENTDHSIRLINRNDARQAISIPWADLSPLRNVINCVLGDNDIVASESDLASSTQDGLTVETALKELREMFPRSFIRVRRVEAMRHDEYTGASEIEEQHAFVIVMGLGEATGRTLAECMSAVRAWKLKEGRNDV